MGKHLVLISFPKMLQYEKCLFLSIVLFSDSIRYNFLLNIFDTVITNVSIFYGAIKYNFDFSFDQNTQLRLVD